jgi:flagellar FliL protein
MAALSGPPAEKPKTLLTTLIAVVLLTLLAGAAGAFYGMQSVSMVTTQLEGKPKESEPPPMRYPQGTILKDLAPIITNLAQPAETWVRLEASLVIDPKLKPLPEPLLGEISNDVLAYMRTVKLKQIEGASGLRQLGEDLNERVSIRSGGKIRELIIQTLVVQ